MGLRDKIKEKVEEKIDTGKVLEKLADQDLDKEKIKDRPLLNKFLDEKDSEMLNRDECIGKLREDLKNADEEVQIYCPFLSGADVSRFLGMSELKKALERDTEVCVVTRPEDDSKPLKNLKESGVEVELIEGFHEKLVAVDEKIVYIGSANILSWPSSSDIMHRIVDESTAKEAINKVQR